MRLKIFHHITHLISSPKDNQINNLVLTLPKGHVVILLYIFIIFTPRSPKWNYAVPALSNRIFCNAANVLFYACISTSHKCG